MLFPRHHTITLDAAIRDLGSQDARVRAAAAHALGDVEEAADREQAASSLVSLLVDPRAEVRCTVALALGDLGVSAAVAPLLARLDDSNREVRQAAAIALGRLGDPSAFSRLEQALAEGPADLRYQAALSLAEIDPTRAFDPLARAVGDGDPEVRENVAAALGMVGDPRAAGWLAELATDPRPGTRFEAACALASLGDARAVEPLLPFVGEGDRGLRAVDALERVGDRRAAPRLAETMRGLLLSRLLRVRAAAALLVLDPGHADAAYARALVNKAARSRHLDVRGVAEEALARLAGPPSGHDDPADR